MEDAVATKEAHEQGSEPYNYHDFALHLETDGVETFASFSDRLHPGEPAPDFAVTRLDGGSRQVVSQLWHRTPLVMEFGSFS